MSVKKTDIEIVIGEVIDSFRLLGGSIIKLRKSPLYRDMSQLICFNNGIDRNQWTIFLLLCRSQIWANFMR